MSESEPGLDATAALSIVTDQRRTAHSRLTMDARVTYLTWAVAWLVAFGGLWLALRPQPDQNPPGWGWAVYGVALGAGIVVTVGYAARRTRGIRGTTVTAMWLWGLAWFIGYFGGMWGGSVITAGMTPSHALITYNLLAALIPGLLYMALGTFTADIPSFLVGSWWIVLAVAATLIGVPAGLLVMALGGCAGMLVLTVVETIRRTHARAA